MKVAIITPYYKEPIETLLRCHNSVINQTYKNISHFLVADGFSNEEISKWNAIHFCIPNCGDYGDTPRAIGSAVACCQNYDAICFLDADCWYEPDHVESMLSTLFKTNSLIVTCPRNLYRMDGTFFYIDIESNGIYFNDTNCYLIYKNAFHLINSWLLKDKTKAVVGDRIFWNNILQSKLKVSRSEKATVNYLTNFTEHYLRMNEKPPPGSKIGIMINEEFKIINYESIDINLRIDFEKKFQKY